MCIFGTKKKKDAKVLIKYHFKDCIQFSISFLIYIYIYRCVINNLKL